MLQVSLARSPILFSTLSNFRPGVPASTTKAFIPARPADGGGDFPVWGASTNELIYVNAKREVVAATLRFTGNAGEVTSVKPLFVTPPFTQSYDISPDGKTFVFTRSLEMQKFPPLALVVNWKMMMEKK